jgi:alcohol dehydrogenase class IV
MDDPRKFAAPEYVYGKGALPLVVQYATNFDIYSAFIVTDPGVIRAGHVDKVVRLFKHEGFGVEVFDSISPGPRAEEVMMGAQAFDDSGCELIIALGGGSPMDAAKTIGFERHRVAIFSKCLIPDVAIIDPETTLTMDRTLTALAGLDAFANAIEAVRLIFRHLPMAVEKPEDIDSRWGVMLGSLHGGLAFSNASLGLNTAMAHSVGGYLDLPHGECNAALLEHAVGADYGFAETKYDRIAEVMGLNPDGLDVAEKIARLKEGILSFKQRVGATRTIADMGMRAQHIPLLVKRTLQDPCMATNPGYFSPKELEDIYGKAL